MIKKVDHIAVVVPDLAAAMKFWVEAFGLALERVESVPREGVDVAFLPVGDSEIELLQPTDPESGVARYLEKRGPGLHKVECTSARATASAMGQYRPHPMGCLAAALISHRHQSTEDPLWTLSRTLLPLSFPATACASKCSASSHALGRKFRASMWWTTHARTAPARWFRRSATIRA